LGVYYGEAACRDLTNRVPAVLGFADKLFDAMDIGDKSTALFIDATQKSRILAVTSVNADVAELNATLSGDFKHRQSQLRFALKLSFILRYRGFLATFVILAPILRQIEPRINHRDHVSSA
jgi:hypothetical protein